MWSLLFFLVFSCLTVFPFNGHLWSAGQIVLRFYVRISYLMIRSLDIWFFFFFKLQFILSVGQSLVVIGKLVSHWWSLVNWSVTGSYWSVGQSLVVICFTESLLGKSLSVSPVAICLLDRKEGNVLFNHTLNTFNYSYMASNVVKDHRDWERKPVVPHNRLLFLISSKGSFRCTNPKTV